MVAAKFRETTNPVARVQALYTLSGLGEIPESSLFGALSDEHPQVRRHAIRLSESLASPSQELLERLFSFASDSDAEVRFQLAFTLGALSHPKRTDALVQLAKSDGTNPWFRTALIASIGADALPVMRRLLNVQDYVSDREALQFLRALARDIGSRALGADLETFLETIENMPDGSTRTAQTLVAGLLEGARYAGTGHRVRPVLQRSAKAQQAADTLIAEAQTTLSRASASTRERLEALQDLVFAPYQKAESYLVDALLRSRPTVLRLAALKALSSYSDEAVAQILVQNWTQLPPELQTPAMDALLARRERIEVLLESIASGDFAVENLASTHRHRLRTHPEEAIRALAGPILNQDTTREVQEAIRYFGDAATMTGVAARGQTTFQERCATCHPLRGTGQSVGPDLQGVRDWDTPRIMLSILNPNAEINPQFRAFTIDTRDGRFLTGVLESETATSVTLNQSGGLRETVLRSQVVLMEESTVSLMPDGLGEGLNRMDMADLIAFLREED